VIQRYWGTAVIYQNHIKSYQIKCILEKLLQETDSGIKCGEG